MFENLSQREKYMAIAVAGLVPILLLFFGWMSIADKLSSKDKTLAELKTEFDNLQLEQLEGETAVQRFQMYHSVSLPSDTNRSVTDYQVWLQGLGKRLELKNFNVPNSREGDKLVNSDRDIVANIYRFNITRFECTLKQLTELLYQLNQTKILHRIKTLDVLANTEGTGANVLPTGTLRVNLTIQVVSLVDSVKSRAFEEEMLADTRRTLDEYHNMVTRRDIFGLPNVAPEVSASATHEFEVGSNVFVDVAASDEDEDQQVALKLVDVAGTPLNEEDADKFDKSKVTLEDGIVEFGLLPVGNYECTVAATDNGWGNKTSQKTISINVFEPDAEVIVTARPEAMDTKISSKFHLNEQVWIKINVRPQGKKLELAKGDSFELDEKTWTLVEISGNLVTMDVDGETLVFRLGSFLGSPEPQKAVSSSGK